MAIHSIGLSEKASESADFSKRFIVRAEDDPTALFLKWRTASGVDVNESFDIALNYRVVPKVTTEGGGISGWATDWDTWAKVRAIHCKPQYVDGGWQWSFDFAALLGMTSADKSEDGPFMDGNVDILYDLFYNGGFGFADRYYDRIEFGLRVKSHYVGGDAGADETIGMPGTATTSPRTDTTFVLDYVPNYAIQGVYCDSFDSVKIKYTCSDLWLRSDDRFCVESMMVFDENGENGVEIAASKPWGTVSRDGDAKIVTVPMSSLSDMPLGKKVSVEVRFNPSYGASGDEFASASLATPDMCQGGGAANTPYVTFTNPNTKGVLEIEAMDSGEDIKPITHCFVKLRGSDKPFDQMIIPVNELTALPYAPRGVRLTFVVVGIAYGDDGRPILSNVVRPEVTVMPLAAVEVVSLRNPSARAFARYNLSVDGGLSPDKNMVLLQDRPLPSSSYGKGSISEWSLSFDIPPAEYLRRDLEGEDAWRHVVSSGDCVMLRADGRRNVVSFDRFRAVRPKGSVLTSVSASMTEVNA